VPVAEAVFQGVDEVDRLLAVDLFGDRLAGGERHVERHRLADAQPQGDDLGLAADGADDDGVGAGRQQREEELAVGSGGRLTLELEVLGRDLDRGPRQRGAMVVWPSPGKWFKDSIC
jgi:hypothetical protein